MTEQQPRRDDGFTLVEVLTVTIIIAILAAIAIPTLIGQKRKGYEAAMRSDLRSLVNAQAAASTEGGGPTADLAVLKDNGYAHSDGVTEPIVVPTGPAYVACVSHPGVGKWLVYDAVTSTFTMQEQTCA